MSKSRIPSSELATRTGPVLTDEKIRFMGLSLGGGKADKACLAVVDYFPKHKKVFLAKLYERIKNENEQTADAKIVGLIEQHAAGTKYLALDVPWRLPVSLRSEKNLGHAHLDWADEFLKPINKKKKPKKIFTPYTQRCVELYMANALDEKFDINHAMGANTAPLLARALYLHPQFDVPLVEVNPRVAVWRIGRSLDIIKSVLRFHSHSVDGEDARRSILQHLIDADVVFLYEQDRRAMVENNHAFEAFLCAITAFLKYKKKTEARPKDFPAHEDWVEIPNEKIPWGSL